MHTPAIFLRAYGSMQPRAVAVPAPPDRLGVGLRRRWQPTATSHCAITGGRRSSSRASSTLERDVGGQVTVAQERDHQAGSVDPPTASKSGVDEPSSSPAPRGGDTAELVAQYNANGPSNEDDSKLLNMSKLWFFLIGSTNVCLVPFMMLYFKTELSFNDAEVGLLSAVRPWLSSASMFGATALADTYGIHNQMLLGGLISSTLLRVAVFFSGGGLPAAALAVAAEATGAPVVPFVDSKAMQISEQTGSSYGEQRLWASAAWGVFSIIAGVALDHFGFQSNFAIYAAMSVPLLWVTLQLNRPRLVPHPAPDAPRPASGQEAHPPEQAALASTASNSVSEIPKPVGVDGDEENVTWLDLLKRGSTVTLLFQSMLQGLAGPGITQTFLFIFLRDLGGSPTMMSSMLSIDCFVEVAIFSNVAAIMRGVGGASNLLLISQSVLVVQLLGYSVAKTPLQVGVVEVLQGVAFAAGWSSVAAKGKALAPPGLETTMMGMVTAAYFGVGAGAGALLGGQLLHHNLGWTTTWQVAGALVGVCAASAVAVPAVWSHLVCQEPPNHELQYSPLHVESRHDKSDDADKRQRQ